MGRPGSSARVQPGRPKPSAGSAAFIQRPPEAGTLERGDSKAVTVDKPGTYTYFCKFHPFMKATVEVR